MAKQRFGNVTPLPSGRWRARVTIRGEPHSDTFDTMNEAQDWLASLLAAKRQLDQGGDWRTTNRGRITFAEFTMPWFAGRMERGELSPRTADLYAGILEDVLLPRFGAMPLALISPDDVQTWHTTCGLAQTRRRQAYSLLSTIMNQAVREVRIQTNPCMLKGARGGGRKRKIVIASPAEVELLADLVPGRYRILVLLGAWSGLRFSELCDLRRKDVLLDPPRLVVDSTVHRVAGRWITSTTKSEAGLRTVHLPPSLDTDLRKHLMTYVGSDSDARLICTKSGKPLARSNWSSTFGRAREKIGRPDLDFHDLRHTQATLSAQAGATLAELMQRMGHSTPNAAMIYQHADAERDRALARTLDEIRQPRSGPAAGQSATGRRA